MQAIVLTDKEQPLVVKEVNAPQPAPGEVLVQVKAAALNHRDLWIQQGQYAGLRFPIILGSDGSGTVAEVGDGVSNDWLGKEVIINPGMHWGSSPNHHSRQFNILGLPHNGTFAEYAVVPASNIHIKPATLNFEQAAALPLAGLTGYRALFIKGNVQPGDTVLVSGVGGGVALMVLQMAVAAGARVFVTSGSQEKIERAQQLGAAGGVLYTIPGWHKLLQQMAEGFDVIIDSAAGDGFKHFVDLANPGGRIVLYGGTQGPITTLNPQKIFWKHLSVLGTTMGTDDEFSAMVAFVGRHQVEPVIDTVFPMQQAQQALERMAQQQQFGKIVLSGWEPA